MVITIVFTMKIAGDKGMAHKKSVNTTQKKCEYHTKKNLVVLDQLFFYFQKIEGMAHKKH